MGWNWPVILAVVCGIIGLFFRGKLRDQQLMLIRYEYVLRQVTASLDAFKPMV